MAQRVSPGRHDDGVSFAPSQRRDGLEALLGQKEEARKEHRASSEDGQHGHLAVGLRQNVGRAIGSWRFVALSPPCKRSKS